MVRGQHLVGKIVVVGAGIAGLACALACARGGAQVQVFEARASGCTTAAALDVVPNLLREFNRIGVAQDCVRRGFAYSGLAVVDEHGAPRYEVATPRLAGDRLPAAVGIGYDDMLEVLATHASTAGARIRRGVEVAAVDTHSGTALLQDGQRVDADLVVLASGAGSSLVDSIFGHVGHGASQGWWNALLPRPNGLERATWMAGPPGRRLLLLPVSMTHAGLAVPKLLSPEEGSRDRSLTETLAGWGALPRQLASLLAPHAATNLHEAASAMLPGPWHRGAVVCVGAAAHAIPRPFGQSAAQAVEDAVVLGELVGAGLERTAILNHYMARRGDRAHRVRALTEQAARWMARPEPGMDLTALARDLGDLVAEPA